MQTPMTAAQGQPRKKWGSGQDDLNGGKNKVCDTLRDELEIGVVLGDVDYMMVQETRLREQDLADASRWVDKVGLGWDGMAKLRMSRPSVAALPF